MAEIENETDLPHAFFQKAARRRERYDVLVIRGTFDFANGEQPIDFAEEQAPLVNSDEHAGSIETNPLAAVLAREGDLIIHKPTTDVHVLGTARPRGARAVPDWVAGVSAGPVNKMLRLCGPRWFERRDGGFRLTPSEPTDGVALDYRYAFGGTFAVAGSLLPDERDVYLMKEDNPAGCGWLPDDEALSRVTKEAREQIEAQVNALERITAPQIEAPDEPIQSPFQRAAAQGLGPVARWWSPRTRYTGTLDERWLAEQHPALPDDFDPRFYQSAHPDMICPRYLQGDETISLHNLLEEGRVSMRLPALKILAGFVRESGETGGCRLELDTLVVDLDRRQVSVVWRATFHRRDPIARIGVGLFAMHEPADDPATTGIDV